MIPDRTDFIRANTAPASALLVPEISLQLASEITPIWQATEAALDAVGLAPPFWAFCWPGGQALARHLLDAPELVRGRRVLDFAAGCGIAAIAAAMAGANEVTACDIDAYAGTAIALNAARNGVTVAVTVDDLTAYPDNAWDVILAGDVCYERAMSERIIAWLRTQADDGATVLLADPGRHYVPLHGLAEVARYAVPTSLELENSEIRTTVLWRVEGSLSAPAPAVSRRGRSRRVG